MQETSAIYESGAITKTKIREPIVPLARPNTGNKGFLRNGSRRELEIPCEYSGEKSICDFEHLYYFNIAQFRILNLFDKIDKHPDTYFDITDRPPREIILTLFVSQNDVTCSIIIERRGNTSDRDRH
jgi:hypothetical protein